MSRLAFVEESLQDSIDLTNDADAATVSTPPKIGGHAGIFQSSYEVFDLSRDAEDEEGEEGEVNEGEKKATKKKKKRPKKKKAMQQLDGAKNVDVAFVDFGASNSPIDLSPVATSVSEMEKNSANHNVSISSFLSKFLATKRDSSAILEPEAIEMGSDVYLAEFHNSFQREEAVSPTEAHSPDFVTLVEDETSSLLMLSDQEGGEDQAIAEVALTTVSVNLYNLPFVFDEADVKAFVRKAGLKLRDVVLGSDDRPKGLLPGMALVEVVMSPDSAATANDVVKTLHGQEAKGRVVRCQLSGDKKRMSLDASRYFDSNISCKCQNCGDVGHSSHDCTQPSQPNPCHLCAGRDHDAGECLNMVCYRCAGFGHHSKDCPQEVVSRMQRPTICVYCGSGRHESIHCSSFHPSNTHIERYVQMTHALIRCLVCGSHGHACCSAALSSSLGDDYTSSLYCPNCGNNGHSVDICRQCDAFKGSEVNTAYCEGPKHEAFFKYPTLAKDLEKLRGDDPNPLYRRILRSGNDMYLFPSLTSQPRNVTFASPQRFHDQGQGQGNSHGRGHGPKLPSRERERECTSGRHSISNHHPDRRSLHDDRGGNRRHSHDGYPAHRQHHHDQQAPQFAGRRKVEFHDRAETRRRRFS